MYERCLLCRAPFPANGILEHIPLGERVAYDPEKARLWLVCRGCRKWSLVPLESRWEALEELERLIGGEARLLSKTDHVGFHRLGRLEVVRIGSADLAEEAWWRYGRQIPVRSLVSRWTPPLLRRLRFGSLAWVGSQACSECGHLFEELPFSDRQIVIVKPGEGFRMGPFPEEARSAGGRPSTGVFSLSLRCPKCHDVERGGLHLVGVEAEFSLARIMAYQSDAGETQVTLQAAMRLARDPDGAPGLVHLLSRHGRALGDIPRLGLTALEIVVNTLRERALTKLTVEALQARWRREEELAGLIDGELSPVARLDSLIRRVRE